MFPIFYRGMVNRRFLHFIAERWNDVSYIFIAEQCKDVSYIFVAERCIDVSYILLRNDV